MTKRLLIIDTASNGLDMALRAKMAGWDVRWWDKPRKDGCLRLAGKGLVDKITDFHDIKRKWLDWADLIYLPDNIDYVDMLEPYRKQGYPILAPSPEAAALELDRNAGQKAMASVGIQIMESKEFRDYAVAAAFVKKNPQFLVSKPSGDANKALSYVASDPADLCYMLDRWSKREDLRAAAKSEGFILQERKYGVEMAVGGFFGPGGWSKYFYENWEYKKLMADDLGVATGEMGTLSRMVTRSKLADKVLLPITPVLEKLGYVGYIDNNCIIDDKGIPWPMEWTMRDGWPTKHNVTAHVKNDDPIQWMLDLVNGNDTMECIDGEVCVSVLIALPDFPYSKITNKDLCGIPIRGADDMEHIHLSEVMLGMAPTMVGDAVMDMPGLVTCGDYTMVVTGTGSTISDARRDAYRAVKKVKIPNNPFYRPDIGAGRMKKQLPELHRLGFAKGLEF
jgi:phosphoribosylamine--glycine ligase